MQGRLFGLEEVNDLAVLLGLSTSSMLRIASTASDQYVTWTIPKRSGGRRQILAPRRELKMVQGRLRHLLDELYIPRSCAHGFVKGRSLVSNAEPHVGQHWVFNIDFADFFASIHFGRVRGVLLAQPYLLGSDVAEVIAHLCCCGGVLPIGAPTSPVLTNMISRRLDRELQRLATRHECLYSRYADDLTFSTGRKHFPRGIGYVDGDFWRVGRELTRIIDANTFSINEKKVRMQSRSGRQVVTGVVVNEKVNVTRQFARSLRGAIHAWHRYGYENAQQTHKIKYRPLGSGVGMSLENVLWGRLAYLSMVRGYEDPLVVSFRLQLRGLRDSGNRFAYLGENDHVAPH